MGEDLPDGTIKTTKMVGPPCPIKGIEVVESQGPEVLVSYAHSIEIQVKVVPSADLSSSDADSLKIAIEFLRSCLAPADSSEIPELKKLLAEQILFNMGISQVNPLERGPSLPKLLGLKALRKRKIVQVSCGLDPLALEGSHEISIECLFSETILSLLAPNLSILFSKEEPASGEEIARTTEGRTPLNEGAEISETIPGGTSKGKKSVTEVVGTSRTMPVRVEELKARVVRVEAFEIEALLVAKTTKEKASRAIDEFRALEEFRKEKASFALDAYDEEKCIIHEEVASNSEIPELKKLLAEQILFNMGISQVNPLERGPSLPKLLGLKALRKRKIVQVSCGLDPLALEGSHEISIECLFSETILSLLAPNLSILFSKEEPASGEEIARTTEGRTPLNEGAEISETIPGGTSKGKKSVTEVVGTSRTMPVRVEEPIEPMERLPPPRAVYDLRPEDILVEKWHQ
ncbi:hypothetical protein COCNU_scaffold015703G000010 [Cocos nucifera]|nr:hypothetical protein [Cocos nucifera]